MGAPRIYAYNKSQRRSIERLTQDTDEDEDGEDEASTSILGLRVSRNGHLFATITQTALIIWQTNVRDTDPESAGSD